MKTIIEKKITHWITYDRRIVEVDKMDHQHLSNIIYFIKYINPSYYTTDVLVRMEFELFKRFDGKLLSYSPKWDWEVDILRKNYWLWPKEDNNGFNIVINGQLVGELKY